LIEKQHARELHVEKLHGNWALVTAYRQAPKLPDERLAYGERERIMNEFKMTKDGVKRIIALVNSAGRQGIALDLSDRRHLNQGRPSGLTPKIAAAIKAINRANLNRKIRTTRRRMQTALKKQNIHYPLCTTTFSS
jgi:hypothetical protein